MPQIRLSRAPGLMIVSCDWEIYYIPRPSRYYLDFCVKYHYESSSKESLPHFIQKLRYKKQNNQQQRQASDAISIYYELVLSNSKNKIATKKKYKNSDQKGR